MKYKPNCVKCGEPYPSDEEDNYYCPTCLVEKNKVAKEVDAKVARMPKRKVKSDFQTLDETGQLRVDGAVIKCSIPVEYRTK